MDTSQQLDDTRLPLLDPQALTREQRDLYETFQGNLLPWAKESGFQAEREDGRLLGPFNALLYSEEIGSAMLAYLSAERVATELDANVREVVILTVGAATQCAYELYAHRAVAAKAGLAQADIDALATGQEPAGLNATQMAAYRFTRTLATDHRIPEEVYAQAMEVFGHKCLVDMVHLIGLYLTTSALLNAFNVPVPATP